MTSQGKFGATSGKVSSNRLLLLALLLLVALFVAFQLVVHANDGLGLKAQAIQVYQRQLEELRLAVQAAREERRRGAPAENAEAQVVALQRELESLRKMQARARDGLPRMTPTLQRTPLMADVEDWAKRPKRAPTFPELYWQLYGQAYTDEKNIILTFPNPYKLEPHMKYPHSSMWQEGGKVMDKIFEILGPEKLKFVVEVGSMHGGSAIRMATELDKHGLKDVPLLCIDPWTGDLNMWLNRVVWEHLGVRNGRPTTYDQFMVNVRHAITDRKMSPHHIMPFPVTSIVGARWLQATGFTPQLIYLDSAHEIDETYYEVALYYNLLEPGGILMGDDYGWQAVRLDVDRFVADLHLELHMFGVAENWYVQKPL
eukprot:TRINITY_DN1001_c1_g4_i1.p1 TRINITY_DN1001_c1_g4~~TRINITY_DN1001_c1_g4_i1.p1  ORF type:complete len:371 (+),score=74.91 TRINITY_DN1001_c1_g4_i1:119-1231(+)